MEFKCGARTRSSLRDAPLGVASQHNTLAICLVALI